jgi:hypothetical protein
VPRKINLRVHPDHRRRKAARDLLNRLRARKAVVGTVEVGSGRCRGFSELSMRIVTVSWMVRK